MGRVPGRRIVPLSALLLCLPALAWAPETRVGMVDEAVRLMPASLGQALVAYRQDLLRGMLTPLTTDGPDRRAPWDDGRLDVVLDEDARELARALDHPTPFPEIAQRFGAVAHDVLEAGFPPGVSQGDGAARYDHFARLCESRRDRLPVVFYGHDDPELEIEDYRAFAMEIMLRASADDRELARTYAAAGDPPDPGAFDDRSVPFAIASLAYSRSINDVVRIWLSIWRRAGGDMNRTPYLKPRDFAAN